MKICDSVGSSRSTRIMVLFSILMMEDSAIAEAVERLMNRPITTE